jgi:UPF0755 protein
MLRVIWRKPLHLLVGGLVITLVLAMTYLYWFSVAALRPEARNYEVKPGTGLSAFARQLAREGVIPEPYTLMLLARVRGQVRDLKAGEYRFRNGITAFELLDQVSSGRVVEYPFTIVEGWSFRQVMDALANAPRLTHTLQKMSAPEIMASLGYKGMHPEGRFFPDTYYYPSGMSDLLILQRAFHRMDTMLRETWESRDSDLPLRNPDEALTLASIVEKETAQPSEYGLIAGVFINRLRMKMKLQTDPTVIYGIGPKFNGNLTRADLLRPTPYNTYVIRGLPPTPIAMPGRGALKGVARPEKTRALYFVSRNDGTHQFSETLMDHNAAVTKFQIRAKSAPAAPAKK